MNEEQSNLKQKKEQAKPNMLLAIDKKKHKVEAVKGIDENGNLQTVTPERKNRNQFLRVDKHGDMLSNFLTNFFSQLREPSRFSFFGTPISEGEMTAAKLQHSIDTPSKEGEAVLKQYEIKQEQLNKNKQTMENQQTNS